MFSSWKRRLCVLVPSTLLFYFEDESADSPNGVIVLDSSTDITRLDSFDSKKFVIRIAPHMPNQTDSRVFHFHVRAAPLPHRRAWGDSPAVVRHNTGGQ